MALDIKEDVRVDILIVSLDGELDSSTAPILFAKLKENIREKKFKKVIFNMNGLKFISSAGWSVFVETAKILKENKKGDIRLAQMQEDAKRVYELLGIDAYIRSYSTLTDAIKSFLESGNEK